MKYLLSAIILFTGIGLVGQPISCRIAPAGTIGSSPTADFEVIFNASSTPLNANWASGTIFVKIETAQLEPGSDVVIVNTNFGWGRCNPPGAADFTNGSFSYWVFCYDATPRNFQSTFPVGVDVLQAEFRVTNNNPPARLLEVTQACIAGDTDPGVVAEGVPYGTGISEPFGPNQLTSPSPSCSSFVLPTTLKFFTAQAHTNNSVLLEWTSSSEINSSHFDIERSKEGLNWEVMGTVQAAGNSSIERDYSFINRNIEMRRNTTKVFYYRLNMIDQDNSQEYSEVKAVRLTNEGYADVTVFPNPTAELLNIDISSDLEDGNIKYEITDIQGRRLITESIDISVQRIHTVNLRDKGLDSGVYMVRLFNDREILSSQKVVLVSH